MTEPRISDRDLRAAFLARASGAPSADLAARISEATSTVKQSRPFLVLPGFANPVATRLAWAAVLAALTIALVGVLALGVGNRNPITSENPSPTPGQSDAPAPSPSEQPSGQPSADPSVEPSLPAVSPDPEPSQPAGPILERYGLGRVITDNLRARSQPGLGPESLLREPLIDSGNQFYILNGPVAFDGYTWYQIQPLDRSLPFGWVATGSREGEPWVEPVEPDCPTSPTAEELFGLDQLVALACYGNADLEVTGDLLCYVGDVDTPVSGPDWIEFDRVCFIQLADRMVGIEGKAVTGLIDQNGGNSVEGRYTVVGHYDDEQATECVHAPVEVGEQPDPAQVYNNCRTAFVVTEVRPAE
jgi:hypothetical protein